MDKSAEAFRTISEVAEALDTPAHVLRFWETRFKEIRPVKRAGGRRYYRPSDVALLGGIRRLLHDDGLTIRGVQKILHDKGIRHVAALGGAEAEARAPVGAAAPQSATAAPVAVSPAVPAAAPPARPTMVDDDLFARLAALGATDAQQGTNLTPPEAVPLAAIDAPEAPMQLDAPILPSGASGGPVPLQSPAPLAAVPATAATPVRAGASLATDPREPAAALLRAMDAVRARDRKPELTSVYHRLAALRDRLIRSDPTRGR